LLKTAPKTGRYEPLSEAATTWSRPNSKNQPS